MYHSKRILASLLALGTCAVLALGAASQAQAAGAAGTWTWTQQPRGGGGGGGGGEPRKMTLTLKVEGEKLTGKLAMPGRQGGNPVETEITDGKVKGEEVSFTVTREFNGNKMVSKYSGKVSGDTLKGKIETDRGGQTNSRDWEAKREEKK